MKIKLVARSKKGRERIQRDGAVWFVEKVVSGPLPFDPTDNGPWLFINSELNGDTRWVRKTNDKDFIVEE